MPLLTYCPVRLMPKSLAPALPYWMPLAGVPLPRLIHPTFALQMEPEQTYSPMTAPCVASPRQFSQPIFAP